MLHLNGRFSVYSCSLRGAISGHFAAMIVVLNTLSSAMPPACYSNICRCRSNHNICPGWCNVSLSFNPAGHRPIGSPNVIGWYDRCEIFCHDDIACSFTKHTDGMPSFMLPATPKQRSYSLTSFSPFCIVS